MVEEEKAGQQSYQRADQESDQQKDETQPQATQMRMEYTAPSEVTVSEGKTAISFTGNKHRDPVRFDAVLKDPIRFREAMSALYAVVGSDYRYVPKDRTAYMAYRRMKRDSAGLNAWQAQMAYFSWLQRNDPMAWLILDPIISVHPDEVAFEVFGKDEGSYAKLSFNHSLFETNSETDKDNESPVYGSTNIDFSKDLYAGISKMRSCRRSRFSIYTENRENSDGSSGQAAVRFETENGGQVLEKKVDVPDTWLRGFLQMQAAATLPHDKFCMTRMDMYNVLHHLRMHADIKRKRRGIRVELVPGEFPRLVLEPWETVIRTTAAIYRGKTAKAVRVWGRRRLMTLKRFLFCTEEIDVHLLGSGLPSFWVLKGREMTFTLGLTGYTAANWSQALTFDLLLPRKGEADTVLKANLDKVVNHLQDRWFEHEKKIGQAVNLKGMPLVEALQTGCQQGILIYDIAKDVYRFRQITQIDAPLQRLEFRNMRERLAHDLLAVKNAVTIETENRIFGTGIELTGKIKDQADSREYRPKVLINEDGHVAKAECTCHFYRTQGLKQGPCSHLIALRLKHAKQARGKHKGKAIVMETSTYTRRDKTGESAYQVSLDRKKLKIRWGITGRDMRQQHLCFNSEEDARTAYFDRVSHLTARGYMNATAE